MWKPPIPDDEADRLEDLRRLGILLTAPEASLDRVTQQLARIFGVPGAFISFIDQDTQHYKSEVGLPEVFADTRTEPRDISLCSYVVGTNEPLFVEDLAADPRFQDNPGVTQFGARFYAGARARGDNGHAVGSLCIVDHRPRKITPREQQMLGLIAEGVMAQVRLQVASQQLLDRSLIIERDLQQAVALQRLLLPEPCVEGGGWRIEHLYQPVAHLGGDLIDVKPRGDGGWNVLLADVTGHGTSAALTATMTKSAFIDAIKTAHSPAEVLADMNRSLWHAVPVGQFVTAQVLMLPGDAGRVTIASAGHPFPLRTGKAGAVLIETPNGLPLMIEERVSYHDLVLDDVAADETILLYTDGAIEAADGERRYLGSEGLRAMLEPTDLSAPGALEQLVNVITRFAQGQLVDDVALLMIRRWAPEAPTAC